MKESSQSIKLVKEYITVRQGTVRGRKEPIGVEFRGKSYEIDRIIGYTKKASKLGGHGWRWACIINGKERFIYQEPAYGKVAEKWFVERRV